MSSRTPMRGRRGWERRLAEGPDAAGQSPEEQPAFDSAEAEIEAYEVGSARAMEAARTARASASASESVSAPGAAPAQRGAGRRLPNLAGLPRLLEATGAFASLRERLGRIEPPAGNGGRHAGVTSVPHGAKSYLAAALAVQLQDLVWLEGEPESGFGVADRAGLDARADEIAGGVAMNPYYRCFEAADGFLAVACLNLDQRRAFLDLFGLEDSTVEAPDLVPDDPAVLSAKEEITRAIERTIAQEPVQAWIERLGAAGVPSGVVRMREGVRSDPQVVAEHLVGAIEQPGAGNLSLLAPFVRVGGAAPPPRPAPELGADTDAVLGELA